jgi:hypothetical protein
MAVRIITSARAIAARTVPCVGGSYTPVDDDCSVTDTAVRVSVTLVSEYAIEEDQRNKHNVLIAGAVYSSDKRKNT